MTKTFLLTLTPKEPYFFGNEKTFSFDPERSGQRSFIKSEQTPLQTSLLGVLRYLLLPVKNSNFRYSDPEQARNEAIVGKESFHIRRDTQDFGAICRISPLFLVNGQEKFVPTPFDHDVTCKTRYTPLSDPCPVQTSEGLKWYFPRFRGKDGIADSYMNVADGALVAPGEIFLHNTRLQIRKEAFDHSYHKRRLVHMKDGWSFGAYVTLDMGLLSSDPDANAALSRLLSGTSVFMGQNKSVFLAQMKAEEDRLAETVAGHLRPGVVYCLGDTLAEGSIYDKCLFAATRLRDYRALRTTFARGKNTERYTGRMTKGAHLHRLLCAGSVLIPAPGQDTETDLNKPNCRKIGLNITISNGEEL